MLKFLAVGAAYTMAYMVSAFLFIILFALAMINAATYIAVPVLLFNRLFY